MSPIRSLGNLKNRLFSGLSMSKTLFRSTRIKRQVEVQSEAVSVGLGGIILAMIVGYMIIQPPPTDPKTFCPKILRTSV